MPICCNLLGGLPSNISRAAAPVTMALLTISYHCWARFPAMHLSLNSSLTDFRNMPMWAFDSIRIGDIYARISFPLLPLPSAQPPGWRTHSGTQHSVFCWLANLHKTCLGDYLFSSSVQFQGQRPLLAADRLRTPGREDFTWLHFARPQRPFPQRSGFLLVCCPSRELWDAPPRAAWLQALPLAVDSRTCGFRWHTWVS